MPSREIISLDYIISLEAFLFFPSPLIASSPYYKLYFDQVENVT